MILKLEIANTVNSSLSSDRLSTGKVHSLPFPFLAMISYDINRKPYNSRIHYTIRPIFKY